MTRTTLPDVDPELDLVLDRVVDVPRDLVYRAWTVPEHLMPWFCPKPWRTTKCEIDLRPGGIFSVAMEGPNGEKSEEAAGCYLEVVPGERVVWTGVMGPGFRPTNVPAGVPAFTCVLTFTTEGFDKPDSALPSRTFPGALARARFDVMTATTTVAMRLAVKGLD